MSPTLLPHPVAELGLLADLDIQEAVLFARKVQALLDYEAACRRQSPEGRAVDFIALDLAVTCGIAQSTATQRLAVARRLVLDLPGTHQLLAEGCCMSGKAWRCSRRPKACPRSCAPAWRQRSSGSWWTPRPGTPAGW